MPYFSLSHFFAIAPAATRTRVSRADARPPQGVRQFYRFVPGGLAHRGDEHLESGWGGDGNALFFQVQDYPFDAGGEADGRGGLAAQLLDEVVVAAAAADGALAALVLRLHLEDGPGVVVQAAHQAVVQRKGDLQPSQVLPEFCKVRGTVMAQIISVFRGVSGNRRRARRPGGHSIP